MLFSYAVVFLQLFACVVAVCSILNAADQQAAVIAENFMTLSVLAMAAIASERVLMVVTACLLEKRPKNKSA